MKLKVNYMSVIEYIIAIFLVLDINVVWVRQYSLGDDFFTRILCILLLFYCLLNLKKIRKKDLNLCALFCVYVFISGIFAGVKNAFVALIEVGIGFALISLTVKINNESKRSLLYQKISDVIVLMSLSSLFFYIFGTILNVLPGRHYVNFYWGSNVSVQSYFNIYYESQQTMLGTNIVARNCGLYTEGPMYAFVISIALIYEMLIRQKMHLKRILILIFAGITTFSTSAQCIIIVCISFRVLIYFKEKYRNKLYLAITMIVVPVLIVIVASLIIYFVSIKQGSSMSIRTMDLLACLAAWKKSPLFGIGIMNYDPIFSMFDTYRYGQGLSTGLLILLAQTGIVMLGIPVTFLYKYQKNVKVWLCFLALLFMYLVTNVPYKMLIPTTFMSLCFINSRGKDVK